VLRLKIPRAIAITITLIIVLIILAVLFLAVSQAIHSILPTAGRYSNSFVELIELVPQKIEAWGLSINQDEIVGTLQQRIPSFITGALGTAFGLLSSIILFTICVIFLLVGRNSHIIHKYIYTDIDQQIRRYIIIK